MKDIFFDCKTNQKYDFFTGWEGDGIHDQFGKACDCFGRKFGQDDACVMSAECVEAIPFCCC